MRPWVALFQGLVNGLNYGLYCPGTSTKAGKFMDDERTIREYSLKDNSELEVGNTHSLSELGGGGNWLFMHTLEVGHIHSH